VGQIPTASIPKTFHPQAKVVAYQQSTSETFGELTGFYLAALMRADWLAESSTNEIRVGRVVCLAEKTG